MKKVIRLTESDLKNFISRIISEQNISPTPKKNKLSYHLQGGDYGPNGKITKALYSCKTNYEPLLKKAVQYWKSYLQNKITYNKFIKVNQISPIAASNIYKEYYKILDTIKLSLNYFTEGDAKDALAFVKDENTNIVYINCANKNRNPLDTLVHEIQHLLFHYYPLNPEYKISKVFSNTPFSVTFENIFKNVSKEIKSNTKINDVSQDYIEYWKKESEKEDQKYICEPTEKMSNIMAIRQFLFYDKKTGNVDPSKKITKEMLIPYINLKKRNNNITYLLYCWAKNGFKDLGAFVNEINDLASRAMKQEKTSPIFRNQYNQLPQNPNSPENYS